MSLDIQLCVARVLEHVGALQFRSPYGAAAQLAWWVPACPSVCHCTQSVPSCLSACEWQRCHRVPPGRRLCRSGRGHAHAAYGGLDLLLFGAERVITSLDLASTPRVACARKWFERMCRCVCLCLCLCLIMCLRAACALALRVEGEEL